MRVAFLLEDFRLAMPLLVELGGKVVGPTYGPKMEAVSTLMGRDILEPKLDNLGWISFGQNCILCWNCYWRTGALLCCSCTHGTFIIIILWWKLLKKEDRLSERGGVVHVLFRRRRRRRERREEESERINLTAWPNSRLFLDAWPSLRLDQDAWENRWRFVLVSR